MATEKKSGGKRPGAGRPKKLKNPINKVIRFEQDMVDEIENRGHELSDYVRKATQKSLDSDQKQTIKKSNEKL